ALDRPAIAQGGDQGLLDHSHVLSTGALDFHAVLDAQHALLDLGQHRAAAVFEDEGLAQTQGLAIHFEDLLTAVVFDPEIIADGHQLLSHLIVVHIPTTTQRSTAPLLALFSPLLSSVAHPCISFVCAFTCYV